MDAQTEPDEGEDEPFDKQDAEVAGDAWREFAEGVMDRRQKTEPNPGGEQKKDAEKMPEWGDGLFVAGCCGGCLQEGVPSARGWGTVEAMMTL